MFHAALYQVWGVLAMRLADTPLLPLAFTEYAQAMQADIQTLQGAYSAPANGGLNFTDLVAASAAVVSTATRLDAALVALGAGSDTAGTGLTDLQLRVWNDKLHLAERAFLYLQGLCSHVS